MYHPSSSSYQSYQQQQPQQPQFNQYNQFGGHQQQHHHGHPVHHQQSSIPPQPQFNPTSNPTSVSSRAVRSSAIPIVAPSATNSSSSSSSTESTSNPNRLSSHLSPPSNPTATAASNPTSSTISATARAFSPGNNNSNVNPTSNPASPLLRGALSSRAASAAVFVPKTVSNSAGSNTSASGSPPPSHASSISTSLDAMTMSSKSDSKPSSVSGPPPGLSKVINQDTATRNSSRSGTPGEGNGWDNEMNNMFDPTYTGPLPSGATAASSSYGATASTSSQAMEGGAPTTSSYNPYAYMEYEDPSLGGAVGGGATDYYGSTTLTSNRIPIRQPLQYHLYAPPLPHVSNLHPAHLSAHAFFMPPNPREESQRKLEAIHTSPVPVEMGGPKLPEELHVYHSLVQLEATSIGGNGSTSTSDSNNKSTMNGAGGGGQIIPPPASLLDPRLSNPNSNPSNPLNSTTLTVSGDPSKVFGYRSHIYKAICTLDGKPYILRRLEGFRLQYEQAIAVVERWRRIRHPGIVSVREAFTTRAWGDSSIVFVYDYHPLSSTLLSEHMIPKPPQTDRRTGRLQPVTMTVPEKVIWSYVCQITSALRVIHRSGLAARCIEPSKVLRTGENRIRLNCCSIFDVLTFSPTSSPSQITNHQAEDLVSLGRLLICLCCNSSNAVRDIATSIEHISRSYSPELKSLISWLLNKQNGNSSSTSSSNVTSPTKSSPSSPPSKSTNNGNNNVSSETKGKTVEDLTKLLALRMADEMDNALNVDDLWESWNMKETENGRLVRLLCKFGFINERPEFDHDPRWSETGDRYIVKLFRDHVFHSVDENGRPVVDLSHILTNLNKLDAGVEEKIMLTSRDEISCLVVSYREIKNCIESAFQDLSRAR